MRSRRGRARRGGDGQIVTPHNAWHVTEAVWGESQRVRLITGPPSLVENEQRIRSVHVLAFHQRDILVVQNRDETWTFPGGRLEGRETPREALAREVWEEARVRLTPQQWAPIAATRIDFLNRVPDRVHPVHPSFLLWVLGDVALISDEPCVDPANCVVGRKLLPPADAHQLIGAVERIVLDSFMTPCGRRQQQPERTG